jgi:hypothetical protein
MPKGHVVGSEIDREKRILKEAQEGRKKMSPLKKWGLGLSTFFVLGGATGTYLENRYDILGKGGVIDEMTSIEPYSGGWHDIPIPVNASDRVIHDEIIEVSEYAANEKYGGVLDVLRRMQYVEYMEDSIRKKNIEESPMNGWLLVPDSYKAE